MQFVDFFIQHRKTKTETDRDETEANENSGSTTPFGRGNAALIYIRGYVSQEVNEKSGSITPFAGGKMLPASTTVVLK